MQIINLENFNIILTQSVYEYLEEEVEIYGEDDNVFTDIETLAHYYVCEPDNHEEYEIRIINYECDNGDVFMKFGNENISKFLQKRIGFNI